jgi:hypothetical protein
MAAKQTPEVVGKALAAVMCAEPDVAVPARARSASFASAVADLKVGGDPAAKVVRIDQTMTIEAVTAEKPTLSEKLRNAVTSSVSQAKRRLGGTAEFSVEISDLSTKSGIYLIALVTRNA